MKLYLRHDLFKADLPTPSPDVGKPSGAGSKMEPCSYGGGEECEKHGGNGAQQHKQGYIHQLDTGKDQKTPQQEDADPKKPGKQEPKSSDPLKVGQSHDTESNVNDTQPDIKAATKQVAEGKTGASNNTDSSPFKPTPFTMNAEDHADTDPMEHYHAANLADKLGDQKMAQFHRQQAQEKIGKTGEGQSHADIENQLREAGYHKDADFHHQARRQLIKQKVDEASNKLKQRRSAKTDISTDLQAKNASDDFQQKLAAKKAKLERERGGKVSEPGMEVNPEDSDVQVLPGSPDTAVDDPATADTMPGTSEKKPTPEELADTQVDMSAKDKAPLKEGQQAASKQADSIGTKQRIENAQKQGQKKAADEFSSKKEAHEKELSDWKTKNKEYEEGLKQHESAKEKHAQELNRIKDRLNSVKEKKPVRNDAAERKIKQKLDEHSKQIAEHEASKPSDKAVKEAKQKLEEHNAKKPDDKHIQSAKQKLKKLSAQAPQKPSDEKALKKYEKKHQAHQKKVNSLKAQISTMEADHQAKMQEHGEKASKLKENLAAQKKEHSKKLEEHKATKEKLKSKKQQLEDKHKEAKAKADEDHGKKMEEWQKKHDSVKSELDQHKKTKLPEKPKPPKGKEPQQTVSAPQSDEEKLGHQDHTKQASELATNIESHLRDNPDLDPEVKERLHKLHEQAVYQSNIAHNPTKEDKAQMKAAMGRAKEHGAHEHHSVVAARNQEQQQKEAQKKQKETDKQQKENAKRQQAEKENTPRKPENEMEEAQLHEHKKQSEEKAQTLQDYLENNEDLDEEDKKHIQAAIDKHNERAQSETLPTKDEEAELKQVDKLMQRHLKAAKQGAKEGAKGGGSGAQQQKPQEKKTKFGTNLMSAWNTGAHLGSKAGTAAASPYGGAGNFAQTVDYAGRGVLHAGHYLLKDRKFGSKEDPQQARPDEGKAGQEEVDKIATKRAKAT